MNKIIVRFLLFISVVAPIDGAFAQQTAQASEIVASFETYNINHLREKLFLHTDKDFYLSGETLWFKVYAVDGTFHKPLHISRTAYVEVIGDDALPVVQAKVAINNGAGHGSIVLPGVKSGYYQLRAYTRWMRNLGPDNYFQKRIFLADPDDRAPVMEIENDRTNVNVNFFPEGGKLVASLPCRIAFRVTDRFGRGIQSHGAIVDQRNDTLVRFSSMRFGIGSFHFTPSAENSYRAIVVTENRVVEEPLPDVVREGYGLVLIDRPDTIHVLVRKEGTMPSDFVTLVWQAKQVVKSAEGRNFSDGIAHFRIPKVKTATGVNRITIFNANKQPVCERLYFRKPQRRLSVQSIIQKKVFGPRERVAVNLIAGIGNKPVSSRISLSVLHLDGFQSSSVQAIDGYLMLSSELRTEVEQPDYYLTSMERQVPEAADNLMLTQSSASFSWKNVFDEAGKVARFAPEFDGQIISGKLQAGNTGTPISNSPIVLAISGPSARLYAGQTDGQGRFEFYVRDLTGATNLVLTELTGKGALQYDLDDPFDDRRPSLQMPVWRYADSLPQQWNDRVVHRRVMRHVASTKSGTKTVLRDTASFYAAPDAVYNLADYAKFQTVEEVLREYVPEMIVRKQNKKLSVFSLNKADMKYFSHPPLVLVDGVPVIDHDRVIGGSTANIRSIEIVARKFFRGPLVFNGILSLKTLRGDLTGFELDSTAVAFTVPGTPSPPSFEDRDPSGLSNRVPMFDDLLHWAPEIRTGADGRASVVFYTGDLTGKFLGVLHAITEDGDVVTDTFSFEVRNDSR